MARILWYFSKNFSTFAVAMRNIPTVTRYLLIANFLIYLLGAVLLRYNIDLNQLCGLHFVTASTFHWWQPFTYMFLHANFWHIFCNMFAVWMFGPIIEREWGERRFLIYYLVCGSGAGFVQEIVWMLMLNNMSGTYNAEALAYLASMLNTVGASGAVFGILFAFGWLFPDIPMFILFIPFPIRARTFVIIYALIELFAGLGSAAGLTSDHVAHFAHLGGLIFGWLLILYWRKRNWQEPLLSNWCQKLKERFNKHPRLDSKDDDRFNDYHYHKRL